jgi:chromosome segregation ATPase
MSNLYNLTAEYQRLIAQDEYTEADLIALDGLHQTIEDRAIHYAYVIKELSMKLAGTQEAINDARAKKDKLEKNIAKIEQYILDTMVNNKMDKIDKCPYFDIKVRHNPVSVDDYDHDTLPSEYWVKKESVMVDKKKIKDDIENLGLVIPGARLVRKVSLQIK